MACYFEDNKQFLLIIEYLGCHDLLSENFIENIINNLDSLEANIDLLNCEVNDLLSLYQFLWINSFQKFVPEINKFNIKDDIKERIVALSKKVKPNIGSFIKYLNQEYEMIFTKNNHVEVRWKYFINIIFELMYKRYSRGIDDKVFLFIEEKMPTKILSKFDICQERYLNEEYLENFKSLFNGLEKTIVFKDKIYVYYLLKINNVQIQFLKEKAEFICKRAINYLNEYVLNDNYDEIISVYDMLQEYYELAKVFKLECFYDISLFKNKMRESYNDCLLKESLNLIDNEIDLSKIINELKDKSDPLCMLSITHYKEGNLIKNLFNKILDPKRSKRLIEAMNFLDKNRSDKYSYYNQIYMDINLTIFDGILININTFLHSVAKN